jgi:Tol biopolymer transport system component
LAISQAARGKGRWFFLAANTPASIGEGGGKIAFVSNQDGDSEILVINADGTGLMQLTENDWDDWGSTWQP